MYSLYVYIRRKDRARDAAEPNVLQMCSPRSCVASLSNKGTSKIPFRVWFISNGVKQVNRKERPIHVIQLFCATYDTSFWGKSGKPI